MNKGCLQVQSIKTQL